MGKENLTKQEYERAKQSVFTPWNTIPFFSGAFLIALLCLSIYSTNQKTKQQELAMLATPQVNDVYRGDLSILFPDEDFGEFKYVALRVASLENDGILFAVSREAYTNDYGLFKKINKDFPENTDYYEEKGFLIPYETVKELYAKEAFGGIHRFPDRDVPPISANEEKGIQ